MVYNLIREVENDVSNWTRCQQPESSASNPAISMGCFLVGDLI